jgi:helicase MOV-10
MLYSSPKNSFSLSLAPPSRAPSSAEKNAPVIDATKSVLKSQNGVLPGGPWVIGPGSHLTFKLSCTAMAMGLHKAVILFDFGTQKIVRYITLLCEDDIAKAIAPIEPYIRLPRPRIRSFYKFVPGIPPPLPFFKKRLEFYPMPANVKEAILKKETLPVLTDGLRKENYSEYFSTLLFAEELQMEVDIRAYDMQNVTMWKVSHSILGLHVPGLAERRPSVIYRDKIYVRPSGTIAREFQGYVHKVQACEVHLRFSDAFHKSFICNSRYDIRFSFGRVNIRRAHQGIQAARALLDSFLFPSAPIPTRAEPSKKFSPFSPFNRTINAEQRSAVSEILKRKGAPPYLIYGPPGTGKTVTVVEAILQIRKAHPNSRILACAPSNSASDLLLERLMISVEKRDMLRLNAYTRPIDEVTQKILPYCLIENNFFCTPDQASLMNYHVVVTTYWSAAMLDAQEIQPGHFTHIFLDEAGQGTEPEAMVPIANLANSNTVVVLAGDHQQLGPLIRSPVALKFGLDKSYLERLSTLTTYLPASANGKSLVYNNSLVTKLVRNYRSHPAILDLPSRLFYDGELVACADESRNSLVEWDELPNKRFPVLFIGIEGRDEREGTSPSWFNAQEASRVVDIVKKVKDYRRSRVNLTDIGVISPYNQQVNKLKKALASQNLGDVKVGSVESFQGQEKRVIIISTVRSSKEHVEVDKKHSLGFLTNPKRFNVAITRAKALLIIVGNPHVLSQDRCWNELLRYCRENNSYIGCAPPSEELNEESKQLHSAIIDNWFDAEEISPDNDSLPASLKAAVEDPQWPDGTC